MKKNLYFLKILKLLKNWNIRAFSKSRKSKTKAQTRFKQYRNDLIAFQKYKKKSKNYKILQKPQKEILNKNQEEITQ